MKRYIICILFLLAALSSKAQHADTLKWLTGTWKIKMPQKTIVESWHIANDSTLEGISYMIKNNNKDTFPLETVKIVYRKDSWYYIATTANQNNEIPVDFRFIFLSGSEFICENTEHDFPQRIGYRIIGNNLYAYIEGKSKGRFIKSNYDYTKE